MLNALTSSWFARVCFYSVFLVGLIIVCEAVIRVSGLAAHLYTEPAFEPRPGEPIGDTSHDSMERCLARLESVSDHSARASMAMEKSSLGK